jgi:hypothetical protein
VQASKNVEFVATGPVLLLPVGASAPLQLPVAVQAVALVELQVNVEAPPAVTGLGAAVSVAVGSGGGGAVTVMVCVAAGLVPPAPEQVSEYVVLAVRGPVLWVPLVAKVPVKPLVPVQAVALVELQVNVAAPPLTTVLVSTVSVAVGGTGAASTVTGAVAA